MEVSNKITKDIREGAIEGFARHGSNGRGEGGFAGFCFYLAKKHPKAAAKIVEKLLPLTINGNMPIASIGNINIVSIPSDTFLSAADIERLHATRQIEHHDAAVEANMIEIDERQDQLETAPDPQES